MSNQFSYRLILSLLVASVSACTTLGLGSRDDSKGKSPGLSPKERQSIVIQQSNGENGVLTQISRERWLELRSQSENKGDRLLAILATGQFELAVSEARGFLRENPRDRNGLMVLTMALALQKNYELAAYYGGLLERHFGNQPEVQNILGLAALQRPNANIHDFHRAIAAFQRGFEGGSQQIASGLNLGHLQLELGDAQQAASTFKRVAERCQGCTSALMGAGIAELRLGRYAPAKERFEAVLAKSPAHPEALYRLALVEKNGYNRDKKAEAYLQQVLAKASDQDREIKRRANFMLRRIQASGTQVGTIEEARESNVPPSSSLSAASDSDASTDP